MKLEGGCFCGAVRFEASGTPEHITHCHCIHCRRTTGAPFVTWAEMPKSGFRWTKGDPARMTSRPGVTRRFCAQCGTHMTYETIESPGGVDVTAGCLDDPEAIKPDDHVWADRMLSWIHMDDNLPRHRTKRGT
jgi:hypothetical protein